MRSERFVGGIADQSALGEEDPGGAMDLFYSAWETAVPHPVSVQAGLANPENPPAPTASVQATGADR